MTGKGLHQLQKIVIYSFKNDKFIQNSVVLLTFYYEEQEF